jgi:hypothetical protein
MPPKPRPAPVTIGEIDGALRECPPRSLHTRARSPWPADQVRTLPGLRGVWGRW